MLYFVSGKKGGGKSLYLMRQLLDILCDTKKHVVTNLPLDFAEIQDELFRRGCTDHIIDRVTVLEPEQMREFYRHRGKGLVVPLTGREPDSLDYTVSQEAIHSANGVVYFIDEIQLVYPARNYQSSPKELMFYNTQERKLGDEVYAAAQVLTHVDKQFRELCQEYRYVRNFSKEKFGKFKRGDYFELRTFYYPVSRGDEIPSDVQKFTLDVDTVARCYNTAEGIGIKGKASADTAAKVKGLPLWSIWVGFAVVFVIGWNTVEYIPLALSHLFFGKTQKQVVGEALGIKKADHAKQVTIEKSSSTVGQIGVETEKPIVRSDPVPVLNTPLPDLAPEKAIWVTGVIGTERKYSVGLSDGRTITEKDGSIKRISRNFVEFTDGKRVYMQKPAPLGRYVPPPPVDLTPKEEKVTQEPSDVQLEPPGGLDLSTHIQTAPTGQPSSSLTKRPRY